MIKSLLKLLKYLIEMRPKILARVYPIYKGQVIRRKLKLQLGPR